MRLLLAFLLCLAGPLAAQTREVRPGELALEVRVENDVTPFAGEMVLLTIHGRYRRHVTRETLAQPALDGFNWFQLGPDRWYETVERGRPVKNVERRMALYPNRAGRLTIGPFTHHLTLTDEGNDWFDHDVRSPPVTVEVRPAPLPPDEWMPVRRLEVSDEWSNPPDQLAPGEGVLRIIRITAVGASPDMLPPMPDLTSPSAMIYPHPEKRLTELSPFGPVAIAFWRWTIQPTNGRSAILEPLSFPYFDTETRRHYEVVISAQRVAYSETANADTPAPAEPETARLSLLPAGLALLAGLGGGIALQLGGRDWSLPAFLRRWRRLDPLDRALARGVAARDGAAVRLAAVALLGRDGPSPERIRALALLDAHLFGRERGPPPFEAVRRLLRSGGGGGRSAPP